MSLSPYALAVKFADSCEELYKAYKDFDIYSLSDNVLSHIVGGVSQITIPENARKFIVDRASR